MNARLVVIDMQRIFRDETVWNVPRFDEAAEAIASLEQSLARPGIYTRFVRGAGEEGAWSAYYDRWPETRLPAEAPEWDFVEEPPSGSSVMDAPTFSKWGPELAAEIPVGERMVLAGVATDCCVLSTALGAVDAGRYVTVVREACAGATDEAHDQALALLQMLSPMCEVVSLADVVG
ncbi:isochorismatase [Sinomonas cellulolyticus]|uniref:Cysteine hydrolase n=1 Tax=Sinomonas cellulolyticus TaxID=2801916 RepID=A0ABS1K391_9MICC|nr:MULTISPECIES: cysteine hydrolase [Sinomonas]MBL0705933.1 cysteine hydrolase [Sinomonas cellulolyticus]GHG42699.1 isochorismatase [Sinomonas sp. KCTC 49339]